MGMKSAKATLRDEILAAVLYRHGYGAEDFFSARRTEGLVAARRDAAKQLLAAGFSFRRTAEILQRNVTTIEYYIRGHNVMKGQRRHRARAWRLLYMLPNDHRETIEQIADVRGISPYDIVRDWLIDRAQFERGKTARIAA